MVVHNPLRMPSYLLWRGWHWGLGPRVFVGPNPLEVFVWFDANLENVWANGLMETLGTYWSM